jgi:hypothetical protein
MLASIRIVVALAIAVAVAIPASAQQYSGFTPHHQSQSQVPRYTPSSPTTSPYLNLLNRGGGPATNYYGLVRPQLQQQSVNTTQAQETQSHEQEIKTIREQQEGFSQPTIKPTGTAGWFQNLGDNPPYQQTSHYYGQWQSKTKSQNKSKSTSAGK